jgi:hypothetical protein
LSLEQAVKLEKKNMKGETQLQRAVIRGDVQLTASLLNEGADANVSLHTDRLIN